MNPVSVITYEVIGWPDVFNPEPIADKCPTWKDALHSVEIMKRSDCINITVQKFDGTAPLTTWEVMDGELVKVWPA